MTQIIVRSNTCQFKHSKDGPCTNLREYYVLIEDPNGDDSKDIEVELCPLHAGSNSVQFHASWIERLDGKTDSICRRGKMKTPPISDRS